MVFRIFRRELQEFRVFVAQRARRGLILLNLREAGDGLEEVVVGVVVVHLGNLAHDQIAVTGLRPEAGLR